MDGRKVIEGVLKAYDEEKSTVTIEDGEGETCVEMSKIGLLKNTVEF